MLGELVNHDYLETLTQCYCENHLAVLEEMAHKFGKNIRYQVAYNKPLNVLQNLDIAMDRIMRICSGG